MLPMIIHVLKFLFYYEAPQNSKLSKNKIGKSCTLQLLITFSYQGRTDQTKMVHISLLEETEKSLVEFCSVGLGGHKQCVRSVEVLLED